MSKHKSLPLKSISFKKKLKKVNHTRVNVGLSEIVKSDIMLAMAKEGYSLKDMSTWVQEATQSFIDHPYWKSLLIQTAVSSRNDPAGKLTSINLSTTLWKTIFKLSLEGSLEACTGKNKIYINIPVSTFLRSAIIHRLYS